MSISTEIDRLILVDHNIGGALDICRDVQLPTFIIPSYRNRGGAMIPRLGEIPSDVLLFLYEDDRKNYPAQMPENVRVVEISKADFDSLGLQWRGINQKRHFIFDWCVRNGISEAIMMDDDIKFKAKAARNRGEKDVFVSLFDVLKLVVADARENGAAIAGPTGNDLMVAHFPWDRARSFSGRPTNCIYMNIEMLSKAGLQYVKYPGIQEDIDLDMQCYVNDIPVLEYTWVKYLCSIPIGGKDSIASEKSLLANFDMVFYERWHDYVKLYVKHDRKTGTRKLMKRFNFKKIRAKDKSVDQSILDACIARDSKLVMDILEGRTSSGVVASIDSL